MTRQLIALILLSGCLSGKVFSQTKMTEYKAGQIFYVSLPDYMSRTIGINSSATIQYKNAVKDVYGFVIVDSKDEMALADLKYSSINEFYDDFIKDFLVDEEKRKVSKPIYTSKGELHFVESDASYYYKDAKAEIFYLVGVVETKSTYYKVLSWVLADNKEKFKADFQSILYSIRD